MTAKILAQESFNTLIETLKSENFTGTLEVEYQPQLGDNYLINRVLIWNQGKIIFAGTTVPKNLTQLTTILGKIIYPSLIDTIINTKIKKISSPNSVLEMIDTLVNLKIFPWHQIAVVMQGKVARVFEILNNQQVSGIINSNNNLAKLDYEYGIEWKKLDREILKRQAQWQEMIPVISGFYCIPCIALNTAQLDELKSSVKEHLQTHITGTKTILEIADKIDKDPLIIAQNYFKWSQSGWLRFISPEQKNQVSKLQIAEQKSLPRILCVDDSPIIQTMVKRALQGVYEVSIASNGVQCLQKLQQETINLLLLDVSMPDIDGLEVCRMIRRIPKYKNLPIIMVTARDGLIDKFKGKIAGSTKYLTKPFDAVELRKNIELCLMQAKAN